MGGRGANSSINISSSLNKIRNAKKENLIVFDSRGNILYNELGNKFHTGYGGIDYKDKIVAHNHPESVYAYPSIQDFKTAEKSGMAKMIVVSKNYTYTYELDKNYKGYGREGLAYRIEKNKSRISEGTRAINNKTYSKAKSGGYKNNSEYKQDTVRQQVAYVNSEYKKLAKNSGYKLTITKTR